LQVRADVREVENWGDANALELLGGPDPGEHEEVGGADASSGEDN
jgi:hypothetical protein